MREIKVFHVDAFSKKAFGGNPAGVVPDAISLSDNEMQSIARELNLSETAFLIPVTEDEVDYNIRFFTPTTEIDFCGHATLASAWILATDWGQTQQKPLKFNTNIGVVPIEYKTKGQTVESVMMTQIQPRIKESDCNAEDLAQLIGVNASDIDSKYPIRVAYTGNWHLLVPIKTRKAIDQATPDIPALKKHNQKENIVTTHLFTFDSQESDCLLYTRDFAPAVGVEEDPVTGSANGALAGYLVLEKIIDNTTSFTIAQGHACGRPGYSEINVESNEHQIIIKVGGSCVRTIAGILTI